MKKSTLSLQFIFLLFLGTIAVLVVVGLVSNWAFKVNQKVSSLAEDEKDEKIDIVEIDLTIFPQCSRQLSEVSKDVNLCYERGQKGQLPQSGACYVLFLSGNCAMTMQNMIATGVDASILDYGFNLGDTKMYVSYSYLDQKVRVR